MAGGVEPETRPIMVSAGRHKKRAERVRRFQRGCGAARHGVAEKAGAGGPGRARRTAARARSHVHTGRDGGRGGPSRARSASRSVRRALLTPQANPGSRYRCGKSTLRAASLPRQEQRGLNSVRNDFAGRGQAEGHTATGGAGTRRTRRGIRGAHLRTVRFISWGDTYDGVSRRKPCACACACADPRVGSAWTQWDGRGTSFAFGFTFGFPVDGARGSALH